MFTNAGMVQFKNFFTGIEKSKEVADYEKYVIDRQYPERNIQNSNPINEVEPQFEEEGE